MKRIFIAVGSSSTKSLSALITRLQEENMYDKYNDIYMAIDTDSGGIAKFQSLDKDSCRIKGLGIQITASDDDVTVFRKKWTTALVPDGGVGGDRTISTKALCWKSDIDDLFKDYDPENHIYLIGSAFGGTSSGLYLNIAEYIDYKLHELRNSTKGKDLTFIGFLMLPTASDRYKTGKNTCAFFADLQRLHWQRRLECCNKFDFKVPSWPLIKGDHFLLHAGKGLSSFGAQGSYLPFQTVFLIPTPDRMEKHMDEIVAEEIFLMSYLYPLEKDYSAFLVDKDTKSEYKSDTCFAGINMIALHTGKISSLKNLFNKEIKKVASAFVKNVPSEKQTNIFLKHMRNYYQKNIINFRCEKDYVDLINYIHSIKNRVDDVNWNTKFQNLLFNLLQQLNLFKCTQINLDDFIEYYIALPKSEKSNRLSYKDLSEAYKKYFDEVNAIKISEDVIFNKCAKFQDNLQHVIENWILKISGTKAHGDVLFVVKI